MDIIFYKKIDTPIGEMVLSSSEKGLRSLEFTDQLPTNESSSPNKIIESHLAKTENQLIKYFKGERTEFDLALDLQGTDFQLKVWNNLLSIPCGETITYKEQSQLFGNPKAIRAIATANGKNPCAIIVPCHRVVGSNGSLTGYAGGIDKKRWLLQHELKFSTNHHTLF